MINKIIFSNKGTTDQKKKVMLSSQYLSYTLSHIYKRIFYKQKILKLERANTFNNIDNVQEYKKN